MTTHRVVIKPALRNAHRQYFKAFLDGREIVERSPDPEFAACRAMTAMGLSGPVEFYAPGAASPGLLVRNLKAAARLCVVETDRVSATIKKWRPFRKRD